MNFSFFDFMQLEPVMRGLKVLLAIMFGYLLGKFAGRGIERTLSTRLDVHQVMVFKRFAFYSILILATITGLNEAGVNLNVLVGAAGVASVAIGFASQTTMSNLVSGIFILLERPFLIGDTIKVGNTTGEVSLMGLFSTILKTPENMMVRIPNEILMKSEITNVTRYPIRRLELFIGVSYAVDIAELRRLILGCVSDLEFIQYNRPLALKFQKGTDRILAHVRSNGDGIEVHSIKKCFGIARGRIANVSPLGICDGKGLLGDQCFYLGERFPAFGSMRFKKSSVWLVGYRKISGFLDDLLAESENRVSLTF